MRTQFVYCVTTMPIPQPAHRWRNRAIVTALILLAVLVTLYLIGAHAQAEALTSCQPSGVTPHTGHMSFNACAHLDTTQVQDRR